MLLTIFMIPAALADHSQIVLERATGNVWIIPAPYMEPILVRDNTVLMSGDYVITSENSRAILRYANQRLIMEPNSQLQIVTDFFTAPNWYERFFQLIQGTVRVQPKANKLKIPANLGTRG